MKKTIRMLFEKETKRTWRMKENNPETDVLVCGTIYLNKEYFPEKPQEISVTVEVVR